MYSLLHIQLELKSEYNRIEASEVSWLDTTILVRYNGSNDPGPLGWEHYREKVIIETGHLEPVYFPHDFSYRQIVYIHPEKKKKFYYSDIWRNNDGLILE